MESTPPLTYPHLNLLRGFAALSVLVYHIIHLGEWDGFPRFGWLQWFHIGWMSVDLFFVISGFVITHSLLQSYQRNHSYKQICLEFLPRRLWRIVPLYALTGACFLLLNKPVHWLLDEQKRQALLHYATFTQSFDGSSFGAINGISWSVALEMQFYLLMLLTFPLWIRFQKHRLLLWLFIFLCALMGKEHMWQMAQAENWDILKRFQHMVRLPVILEEFAFGMVLALWRKPLSLPLLIALVLVVGNIFFPLYYSYGSYWDVHGMVLFGHTGVALFFALIVAIAINVPAIMKPNLLYRAGFYLGEISYGIYLWHGMVITLLYRQLGLEKWMLLAATLMIVLPLSMLTWHGLEKPCIAYGKQFSTMLRQCLSRKSRCTATGRR